MINKYPPYKEYMNSPSRWFGNIPKEWVTTKLKYISNQIVDGTHSTPNYIEKGVPFLRVTDITKAKGKYIDYEEVKYISFEEHNILKQRCFPKKNDLLLSKNGTIGITRVVDWEDEFSIFVSLCLIKLKIDRVNPYFIDFIFQSDIISQQLNYGGKKSTITNLHLDKIKELEFVLPPLSEQRKIVYYLNVKVNELDNLIKSKEKMIVILEEKCQAMITEAVTKGINPNMNMKDSGVEWIGEIPEHWEIKKIKHLLLPDKGSIKTGPFGSQLTNQDMEGSVVKVLNQRNVLDNDFIKGDYYISKEKFNSLSGFEVFADDILVTTRGTIGKVAIVPKEIERGILHPCLIRIQVNKDIILSKYLKYIFNATDLVKEQVFLLSNATTIEVIYSETLKNIVVSIPSMVEEQREIVEYLDCETADLNTCIGIINIQIQKLKEYRQSLIYEAVTGKVDVRNFEIEQ